MKDLIKRYWDILGGTITGLFLSIIAKWKLDSIQLIYTEIILILVCIGLFKVLKNGIDNFTKGRKKIVVDKLVENQKPMKAITLANEPTKTGEELGEVLIDTMKGGKKIMEKLKKLFVWIGKYWQQLLGIGSAIGEYALYVYALVCDKLNFILQYLPQNNAWQICGKVGIGIIVLLVVALQIRNMCKWVGVGSVEKANEYLTSKKEEVKEKLSPTARENIKKVIKEYKSKQKEVVKKVNDIKSQISEFTKKIDSTKELLQLGLGDNSQYHELVSKRDSLNAELTQFVNENDRLTQEIAKYKQVL